MLVRTRFAERRFVWLFIIVTIVALTKGAATPTRRRSPTLLLSSLVVPGSGQALLGHPIKGGMFLLVQGVLGGMALNQHVNYTWHYDSVGHDLRFFIDHTKDVLAEHQNNQWPDTTAQQKVIRETRVKLDSLEYRNLINQGDYRNSAQLTKMYLTWVGGLYLYNVMDALQLGIRLVHPVSGRRSPTLAVCCSMLLPGLGQIYNGSYSKAGMIWMAQTACAVSALWRHDLMRQFEKEISKYRNARVDTTLFIDSTLVADWEHKNDERLQILEGRFNGYRRARNSFIWYSLGIYFYNVFDALVDAHLHDFDDRINLSLGPTWQGPGMRIDVAVKLKQKKEINRTPRR